jgi:hypothetical protein
MESESKDDGRPDMLLTLVDSVAVAELVARLVKRRHDMPVEVRGVGGQSAVFVRCHGGPERLATLMAWAQGCVDAALDIWGQPIKTT